MSDSRYPHICPKCHSPAYQSPMSGWKCSQHMCVYAEEPWTREQFAKYVIEEMNRRMIESFVNAKYYSVSVVLPTPITFHYFDYVIPNDPS